jgi:antibiotic biosynthesis monooxygenase (ABM) superfamily enzyme
MSAAPNTRSAVIVLVTRRVVPEHAEAFERGMRAMMAAADGFAGHLGGQLVRPEASGAGSDPLYHVVFAFDTEANLRAWQESPQRAAALQGVAPYVEGGDTVRRVPGLEHWFSLPAHTPPPRWKIAIVTWCGICPTVWVVLTLLGPVLAAWPSVPRVMVLTAVIVGLMTWLVAPRMTRFFAPWLYRKPPTPAAAAPAPARPN